MIKDDGTTFGFSRNRKFGFTLKPKSWLIAAIRDCRSSMPKPTCPKSAAKSIRYPQSTRPGTAPSQASASFAKTSSPCSNGSKSSATATETAIAASASAFSLSLPSTTPRSKMPDGYARGLVLQPEFRAPGSPSPMAAAGALLMSSPPQRPGEDMLGVGRTRPDQTPWQPAQLGYRVR